MSEGRVAPPMLIAVGGICTTTLYRVPAVPAVPGKVLATDAAEVVDGMAVSAACAFVRLGGQGAVWGRVGDDSRGVGMRRELAAAGLDVSAVRSVPGGRSSIAVSIIDARGDRLVVPYHDASLDAAADWLPLERIASADFVHVDTRWPEGAAAALVAARASGVPGMLDADIAPPDILARLVPLSSHAVFSDAGLFLHTGMSDLEAALRLVAADHSGHVGASCGADGYAWIEAGELWRVPAPRVEVVDTLAAGDVFHGALALRLAEGATIEAAARFAVVAASLKCTRFGGRLGCPSRDEVERHHG
ncbi:MAG: PfkB family carbohydrate kinase [Planctomycetota bacterium]|nr:PfkB family carbohydrate kinase [Planctomycetota bacterium]